MDLNLITVKCYVCEVSYCLTEEYSEESVEHIEFVKGSLLFLCDFLEAS